MIALIITGVVILLALVGRTSIERLKISKDIKNSIETYQPGKHRVEFDSMGKKVVANLFIPADFKEGEKRPAIVVAPPATSVKEQAAGFYAEKLCKKGFITLAPDTRGIGESEGIEADSNSNPYVHANDISSAVTFLKSLKQVEKAKLFNVSVCAGVVGAVIETAKDKRIKGLGTVVSSITGAELTKGNVFVVRWIIYVIGRIFKSLKFVGLHLKMPAIPAEDKLENADQGIKEVAAYYPEGKVGFHPRWVNGISSTSLPGIAKAHVFNYSKYFNDTPVFMMSGENAYSFELATRFFNSLKGQKESKVLDKANHVEFYWKDEYAYLAVDGIDNFFKKCM